MNPNNQHLPRGKAPLPWVYIALSVIWFLLLLLWTLNWLRWRRLGGLKLHRLISLIPLLKFLWVLYSFLYWQRWSTSGSVSFGILSYYYAGEAIFNLAFFSMLLLASKGWGITRLALIPVEKRALSGIFWKQRWLLSVCRGVDGVEIVLRNSRWLFFGLVVASTDPSLRYQWCTW